MNAYSFGSARRPARLAHNSDDHSCCDTAAPNPRAQKRGFLIVVLVVAVVAVIGAIFSTVQGFADMFGAFTSAASLLQASAWDRFFTGFGRISALALVLAMAFFVIRWRIRHSRSGGAVHKQP